MIRVGVVRPSYPIPFFHTEGIWQGHLLKLTWMGAGVRGREFRKIGCGIKGGWNSHRGK